MNLQEFATFVNSIGQVVRNRWSDSLWQTTITVLGPDSFLLREQSWMKGELVGDGTFKIDVANIESVGVRREKLESDVYKGECYFLTITLKNAIRGTDGSTACRQVLMCLPSDHHAEHIRASLKKIAGL